MNKDEIMDAIIELRSEQANVTPDERVEIQEQIKELYEQLDN